MELHATVRTEDDGSYWAEVKELPGCFASGSSLDELTEGLIEAIGMCLPPEAVGTLAHQAGGGQPARINELTLVTA